MEWINKDILKENDFGFVYIIKHKITGKYYVGKKSLQKYKTINKKKVYSPSNWNMYWGSNKDFLEYIKVEGKEMFTREIIIGCTSSYQLTYQELKYQIIYNWESNDCFNSNLLGKFYKNKIKK